MPDAEWISVVSASCLDVTSWLLVDQELHQLPRKPWVLEDGLRRLIATSARDMPVLTTWATSTSWGGTTFPGLLEVQWELVRTGLLVPATHFGPGRYVVDPWLRWEVRADVMALRGEVRDEVLAAASYVAELVAYLPTSSKSA